VKPSACSLIPDESAKARFSRQISQLATGRDGDLSILFRAMPRRGVADARSRWLDPNPRCDRPRRPLRAPAKRHCSGVTHSVRLPRACKAWSYSRQLFTETELSDIYGLSLLWLGTTLNFQSIRVELDQHNAAHRTRPGGIES
jgi:hypothetical protein